MALYDEIGSGYAQTRLPDGRILRTLLGCLRVIPGSTLLDVGAGHGKYANALAREGYRVIAIEPSDTMRDQSEVTENVTWVKADAEDIPLESGAAQGAFLILSLHHFQNRQLAFTEVMRVVGAGPIVVFTFEPSRIAEFWLTEYFPALGCEPASSFSQIRDVATEVAQLTKRKIRRIPFALPGDLRDKFAAACWNRPEEYLNESVRKGISSFRTMNESDLQIGLQKLSADLSSGTWDKRHRHLRGRETYDLGYQFIVAE